MLKHAHRSETIVPQRAVDPWVALAFAGLVALVQVDCAGSVHTSDRPSRHVPVSSERPAVTSSSADTPNPPAAARRTEAAGPGVAPRKRPTEVAAQARGVPADYVMVTGRGKLGPGPGTLALHLIPPAGGTLAEGAPLRLEGRAEHISFPPPVETRLSAQQLPLRLEIDVRPRATGPALIDVSYYWCSEGEISACRAVHAKLAVELDLTGTSPGGEVHIEHRTAGIE